MTHANQQGFTLIELVMVIIVLGILSYGAMGLFATRDAFTPAIVSNQFISSARLAQQAALARQVGDPVRLVINQTSDRIQFDVIQGALTLSSQSVDRDNSRINFSILAISGSCGALSTSFPVTVTFDRNGNTGANTHVCVSGEADLKLCIASTGYAHASACL